MLQCKKPDVVDESGISMSEAQDAILCVSFVEGRPPNKRRRILQVSARSAAPA